MRCYSSFVQKKNTTLGIINVRNIKKMVTINSQSAFDRTKNIALCLMQQYPSQTQHLLISKIFNYREYVYIVPNQIIQKGYIISNYCIQVA
jgi:hypothetical protein